MSDYPPYQLTVVELPDTFKLRHLGDEARAGQWSDYAVTVTHAGRDLEVAELTVYPDGHAYAMKSARVRTTTAHQGWAKLAKLLSSVGGVAPGPASATTRERAR